MDTVPSPKCLRAFLPQVFIHIARCSVSFQILSMYVIRLRNPNNKISSYVLAKILIYDRIFITNIELVKSALILNVCKEQTFTCLPFLIVRMSNK